MWAIGCLWAISAAAAAQTPSEWIDDSSTASTLLSDAPSPFSYAALKSSLGNTKVGECLSSAYSRAADSFGEGSERSQPCCNLCPDTYGWLESLQLWRNNQNAGQALVQNLNTNQTLLAADNLRFGMGAGVRAGFGVRDCCGVAWEFNYFGLYGPVAHATVTGPNDLRIPGDLGLAVNNFFGVDIVDVRYASTLNNFEINRVCCCCCCDCPTRCRSTEWLYGFRYLNLHEIFRLSSTDLQESTSTYRTRTNNNLFGPQVGARVRHCYGQWSWEGTAKAGIFGNAAQQAADPITDFPNHFLIRSARSANGGSAAFVGDLNLTGIYHINSTWGLRTGYNLIWIEGVALAPDQLDFTNTPSSGSALVTGGGVFLHGINLGAEARW
jgi:hypothetical protein